MAQFSIPGETPKSTLIIETFRGVDLNNSPTNVDKSRSPAAPNMIRDQVGKVRKRMGYTTAATAPDGAEIHGIYHLEEETLVHAGGTLYRWDGSAGFESLGAMADNRSRGFVFDKKLYLLDGEVFRVYDGETLKAVADNAHVPTIIINRNPTGGGQAYEALNLLSRTWEESFLGTADAKEYQLTTKDLSADPVTAQVLNSDGEWVDKVEGTDFTVDRAEGLVTFNTEPGESPVNGQDNVKIRPTKDREGYLDKINRCTVFSVFGVGGAPDRVFLSGNPNEKGVDWYSEFEDPAFFPDTAYTRLSRDGSSIVGYAVLGNALAAFLDNSTDGRNVIVRTGGLDESGNPMFRINNTLIGENAVAPDSFAPSNREPLFLTEKGVYAITAEELTGEKISQERSYYIGEAIQEAQHKTEAIGIVYRDFYVLALDGTMYLMDLQQKTYEKNSPYSSFQYECYYWPEIPVTALWVEGEALCFGTEEGKLCKFATNVDNPGNYNDDGKAIDAYWETSDFDGQTFFKSKTFTGLAVRLAAATQTGVKVFALKRGVWGQVFDAKDRARFFDWSYIDFSKFTFNTDQTPRTLYGKIKIKKVDKVRFRLRNSELNEPFGLYAFGLVWREPGSNYKR